MTIYTSARIQSVSRPNLGVGLLEFHNTQNPFTREALEQLTNEDIGFYIDGDLMQARGDERFDEQFVLQGGVYGRDWVDIKPIQPLPGLDPDRAHGQCAECDTFLTEKEANVSPYCTDCL